MDDYHYHRKVLQDVIDDHTLLGSEYESLDESERTIVIDAVRQSIVFTYLRDCTQYTVKFTVANPEIVDQELTLQIASFLTDRFTVTQKTPGIRSIYYLGMGDDLTKIIKKGDCPSLEDSYLGDHTISSMAMATCYLLGTANLFSIKDIDHRAEAIVTLGPKYYLTISEIGTTWNELIFVLGEEMIKKISTPESVCLDLDRMIFQLLFTLAVIQEQYPGFSHSELNVKDVLCRFHSSNPVNRRVYHFQGKSWELASNGWYAKLDNFERSYILPIESESVSDSDSDPKLVAIKTASDFPHPFTPYDDAWYLLYHLHIFLKNHFAEMRYPYQYFYPVLYRVERLLDMTIIDKLSVINPSPLQRVPRTLALSPKTLATAKTPREYLVQGYFDHLSLPTAPSNKIELHYNQPT